jgi:MATE family multidrug resistance protein
MTATTTSRTWAGTGSELRASLALGWPLVMTNLAQSALVATDVVMIGHLGADALAASVLAASLYQSFAIFGLGLMSATVPLLAAAIGRRLRVVRAARDIVRQGLWSAVLACLPLWLVLWHTESLLVALGQPPGLAAQAAGFMRTLQWALLPHLGYIVLRSFLAARERPLWTLGVAGVAIGFNALADWCLVFGHLGIPALGLRGSGIATTASSTVMFAGLALVLLRHPDFRRWRLFAHWWQPDWRVLGQVWRLGLPVAVTFAFETSIFYAAVVMMGLLGPTELAAHAIAIQIASLCFMVPVGLGQVAAVRVGRAYGAGDTAGARRAGWSAYALTVAFTLGSATVMLLAPHAVIGLFIDPAAPDSAAVAALAVHFLAVGGIFQLADGAQAVVAGMLRGLQDTRVPMLFAALGYWGIGLPLGALLAFPLGVGGVGIWIGLAVGLAVVAVLTTRRWQRLSGAATSPRG